MKRWFLWPILVVYLTLSLYQLHLPGLHYDEAFEVVPAMQLLRGQPVTTFRDSAINLFGRTLPLTTQDYIGALNTYGCLPFLATGGITVASLRAYAVSVGLLTLLLVYGFTTELTRRPTAGLVAVALLAVNPTFIFWNRQGIFVTAVTAAIGVGAAWSWLRWWRTRRYRYALLGAFLFGLGLYAKLLFLWLVGALFGAFLITALIQSWLQPGRLRAGWPASNISLWQGLGLLLGGAFGCWPLILYNLQTGGTWRSVGENAATSYYGVNNAAVVSNLLTRIDQLWALLGSNHLWYLGRVTGNPLLPPAFVAATLLGLWWALRRRRTTLLIPVLVVWLVVGQSIVTVSALWITHYALIMVWPAIALAVAGVEIIDQQPQRRTYSRVWPFLLAVLLLSDGATTVRYHQALTTSGGLSDHSDAIYDLAAWLDTNVEPPVIAMDWGLAAPVTFLTAGRITPLEVFGYEWERSDRLASLLNPYLAPRRATFLWRSPEETIFRRSDDFKALYRPLGLEETILEAFYERSGRPVLGATQLVPQGTAENRPQE